MNRPYDEMSYDDSVCFNCGDKLPDVYVTPVEHEDLGFCSKECLDTWEKNAKGQKEETKYYCPDCGADAAPAVFESKDDRIEDFVFQCKECDLMFQILGS